MTFSLYCRFCDAYDTRLGSDQTPDPSWTCERCAHAFEAGAARALELGKRRVARWKLAAKRYRGDAAEWRAAFEAAARMAERLRAGAPSARLLSPERKRSREQ